jgi:DNA-binding winged helix-turn-helix (wHTH) protein
MPKQIESAARTIRFADFEVDLRRGELRRRGLRVRIQDQPFKVLLALLEKPGEVVTRDELRNRIWGAGTFVEFDHGLNAAVNRLRESLCDSAEEPEYVETVARRGYRFLAPVEGGVTPASERTLTPAPRTIRLLGAGLLLVVAGLALWYRVRLRPPPDPHSPR